MNETQNTEKRLTDAEALEIIEKNTQSQVRIADTWVPRTILYPVSIEYKPGVFTGEIRAFVRQGEWVHSTQWEQALELEKEYSGVNKKYTDALKAEKKTINIKSPSNLLNATPLGIN